MPRFLLHLMTALASTLVSLCFPQSAALADGNELELPPPAERQVDFVRDIRPIFAKHCYRCHGPEKQEADLRLDRKEAAQKGSVSGPIFKPGKSDESLVIDLTSGLDPTLTMPPEGEPLTREQVGLLRAWIDQGAPWPDSADTGPEAPSMGGSDHWSFQPITRPAVPDVADDGWVRNPIDAFILARLESEGIEPSPEADRATLIRRLSFDLLGLPPTPDEVDEFLSDTSPDAYARRVDRLLESPHFGERWGRHWLDLARYADSDGYEKDLPRPYAWRWRDWVIDAINRDLPFDQFTVEQLAGDLLPDATLKERVATGFHRNTLTNREGGVDREEDRVKIAVDRTDTTGTVWLGLTIGCAQCHSHKFDPISQREFYEMYSFFNNTDEADISAPRPEELAEYETRKQRFDAEHAPLVAAAKAYEKETLPARQADWERQVARSSELSKGWQVLTPASVSSAGGAEVKRLEDGSLLFEGQNPATDEYALVINTELKGITALRLEAMTHESLPKHGPGRAENGNFVLSEIELSVAPTGQPSQAQRVRFAGATSDFDQNGFEILRAIDGKSDTGWAVGEGGTTRSAIFFTEGKVGHESGTLLKLVLKQQHGKKHQLGRLRLSATTVSRDCVDRLPTHEIAGILALPEAERSDEQKAEVSGFYASIDADLAKLEDAVREHNKQEPSYPETKAQTLVQHQETRKTYVHIRGDFLRKGAEVQPGIPAVLSSFQPRGLQPDRLDLARWIVDKRNPLTARVAANRIWQHLFGRGIVSTPEDFGTRGEPPTHPELLDWLANEYVARGWSRKEMIRLIVDSATYRQSSRMRSDLTERDPNNTFWARQNRYRLNAETIRDAYLRASGLLNTSIGGPSVRPPLPADVAALGYANSVKWPESKGRERYRRGLYIFFQRTVPYPMLSTFDAPDSNVSCTRRERSNTPLQALTLLNDPVFFECAQALARRSLEESSSGIEDRIRYAFRVCLTREPEEQELSQLTDYYADLLKLSQADTEAAEKLAAPLRADGVESAQGAAWVALARTILNLDEFVTRE